MALSGSPTRRRSESPKSPISPTVLPAADYITFPLEPITEHVEANHSRPFIKRERAGSVASITWRSKNAAGEPKTKAAPASRIRSASPPPPA